jgi:hypothetical protein
MRRLPSCFPLLAAISACGSSPGVSISARLDPADSLFGAVEVYGLSRRDLGNADTTVFVVRVQPESGSTMSLPPLAGRYEVSGPVLRFLPRYRPAGGIRLQVTLKADSTVTYEFTTPVEAAAMPSTVVQAVYPSLDIIPANHLRWYLEFSAPMREGEAERAIHLLDEAGREVDDAFLLVSEELWDPSRRRLTVLFDPGRVKRGVRQNLESGAPLVAGRSYTLRIDPEWRDGRGAPLARGMEKRFRVTDAVRQPLDPRTWRVEPPRAGSRDPVRIDFGRSLDRALAERLVAVMLGGEMVTGAVSLGPGEREWSLIPALPWPDRELEIQVSPLLEDPAGNRVGMVFDREQAKGEWQGGDEARPVTIPFRPLLYSSARPGSSVGRAHD